MKRQFCYISARGPVKGDFNVYQGRDGRIHILMGSGHTPLTAQQVLDLNIDLFGLFDYDHEAYRKAYGLMPVEEPEHLTIDQLNALDDAGLEKLWDDFGDIPIDDEDDIERQFHIWSAGTFREDIWHWFDERHSKGVHWLMYERKRA